MNHKFSMIEQVAWNTSSLILLSILQETKTLQLFIINTAMKLFTKFIKNARLEGWG